MKEKNFAQTFEDLKVYAKAFEVSLAIHKKSLSFPKIEQYSLANQLRRSTKSVCANIAEGFSKQRLSKAEFKRFVSIAIGSANESLVWIDYADKLGYIDPVQAESWREDYLSICRMLQSLYSSLASNH